MSDVSEIDRRKWPHNTPWGWRALGITEVCIAAGLKDADLNAAVFTAYVHRPTKDDIAAFANILNAAVDEQDRRNDEK